MLIERNIVGCNFILARQIAPAQANGQILQDEKRKWIGSQT